ncbi:NLI interacting factor-like phosphatase [Gemmata sp. SH-PL17]|uniref:NIF family HAD-type phosphatase n=1 Tax=Gemmata sp. SH-PL17 TaxID=1630693 RepID=UPI0004AEF75F|nr:NIF family HAD-type phosphatase [Gemmata sp. SH-PL17]AMV29899.1 NLI interacting factor-like phosphatase [Gemmata sp. SH-PL17]
MAIRVLALDLERTLISDANRADPRPGLSAFLAFCHARFERVVLFTTVEEPDARDALDQLITRNHIPGELLTPLDYVPWVGEHKDLAFVAGAVPEEILLVDDDAGWIRPDQRDRWIAIEPWDGGADRELARVQHVLAERLEAEGRP